VPGGAVTRAPVPGSLALTTRARTFVWDSPGTDCSPMAELPSGSMVVVAGSVKSRAFGHEVLVVLPSGGVGWIVVGLLGVPAPGALP